MSLALAAPTVAQQSASMPLAKELGTLLDQKKLDSVAARMPGDGNRFVAALYYPNSQLLVVSASYSVPALLQEQIWEQRLPQPDIVYENGVQQVMLNGDWRSQKLSKDEYLKRIDEADPRYSRMLAALLAEL